MNYRSDLRSTALVSGFVAGVLPTLRKNQDMSNSLNFGHAANLGNNGPSLIVEYGTFFGAPNVENLQDRPSSHFRGSSNGYWNIGQKIYSKVSVESIGEMHYSAAASRILDCIPASSLSILNIKKCSGNEPNRKASRCIALLA